MLLFCRQAYIHWKALEEFKISYHQKGNGVFIIAGQTVQGENINGALYLRWNQLASGKIIYKAITGGYNFIYNP